MTLLAHLSDPHLDSTARSVERVTRVMNHLRALRPPVDAVIVTGDIADTGSPAEYAEAARLFAAPVPVLFCPGNHDDRRALRTALLHEPAGGEPINSVRHIGDLAVVLLDSTIPGAGGGRLDTDTLRWLSDVLDDLDGARPVVLGLHHPPVPLHHPVPDTWPLHHREDLAEALAGRPEVVAILAGHAHTAATTTFAGRPVLLAPAITWTLRMPWESTGEPADLDQPPALAYHLIDDERRVTTHFRVLP